MDEIRQDLNSVNHNFIKTKESNHQIRWEGNIVSVISKDATAAPSQFLPGRAQSCRVTDAGQGWDALRDSGYHG